MKDLDRERNRIIDEFYGEYEKKPANFNDSEKLEEFSRKLSLAGESMDMLQNLNFDVLFDPSEIIEKAERIQTRKHESIKLAGFILAAILILTLVVSMTIFAGIKFIIYTQIFLSFNLPLIIIPALKLTKGKEELS